MKKAILTISCLIAGAVGVLAQGVVLFDNNNFTYNNSIAYDPVNGLDYRIYLPGGGNGVGLITDTTWTAALWEIPATGDPVQVGAPVNFRGSSTSRAGYWTAGSRGPLSVPAGVNTMLEVRIYDGTGKEVGKSPAPFQYKMLISDPPGTADTLMVNFRGFAVPEPSTIALGVLGLGALLLFRRRK